MNKSLTKRIIDTVLIFSFISALIPYASALFGKPAQPDILAMFAKTTTIGEELSFTRSDFEEMTTKGADLDGIIICDLPDPDIGVLKFEGRDLQQGEALTVEGIDDMRFIPFSGLSERASFSFMPVFRSGVTGKTVTVALNVLNESNAPPAAKDITIVTARNIAISGAFSASDPDGDELTYNILDKPEHGNVEICLDNPSKFMYTPFKNKTGKDSFSYVAVDSFGNTSKPAKVSIRIEKPRFKLMYSDMIEDGLHYPAIALAEKGVLKGESIGDESFLRPTRIVSRSEFIAMVTALFGLKPVTESETFGFADEADTPAWAMPYMVSALKQGIITGGDENGVMVLRPRDAITRGEAAIIINNALRLSDAGTDAYESGIEPAWARRAVINTFSGNILTRCEDGSLGLDRKVTRRDAVEILYNAMLASKQ